MDMSKVRDAGLGDELDKDATHESYDCQIDPDMQATTGFHHVVHPDS